MKVLIVAEHASARFGGEAALPLHYYRVLRARGMPVWLITHARVRDELAALFPADIGTRIRFIEDGAFHRAMWRLNCYLPDRVGYVSAGFASRLATQWAQRRLARQLQSNPKETYTVTAQDLYSLLTVLVGKGSAPADAEQHLARVRQVFPSLVE